MKKFFSILIAFVMLLGSFPALDAQAVTDSIRREWIAEFESNEAAKEYAHTEGGTYIGGPFVLVEKSRAELEKAKVVSLTENTLMHGSSVSSITDTYASEQYVLTHKTLYAQSAWSSLETYLARLATPLTPADCNTVKVAVIDSGIDATHEDLSGRVVDGYDAVNKIAISKTENSDVSKDFHGTKVAGLIGAASDNALGIAGMAWTFPVELIPVRVLDNSNNASIADIVAAIYWSVDEGEADILNLSFGKEMKYVPSALQTAVYHAIDNGVLVVAAAGNNGKNYKTYYPAALEGVMPVGSLSKTLYNGTYPQKADFSNETYYETDCGKSFFYTPGEELLTTSGNNTYESFTGTSASAATFTGMLAALKSCADTSGAPGVENYLSYAKYSYLGALYYQDYSYMATALVNGYTSNDVRFTFNEYTPYMVKGEVKLEGVINDPNMLYKEIRFYVDDVFVDSAERTATVKQRIEFTWDTTQFEDDTYYYSTLAICGVDEDGNETEIELDVQSFIVCNESDYYTVKILSNGSPLVGAPCYLSTGAEYGDTTNSLGEIYIYPEELGDDAKIMVISDDVIINRKLEKYPAANSYTFGNNPAMLTISVSEEQLESFYDATIYIEGFDKIIEAGKITSKETHIAVDADEIVTVSIASDKAVLKKSLDLSEDFVWKLDEEAAGSISLTHDNKAPTDTEDGYVTMLGLEIEGLDTIMLPAEGGSLLISPGEYNVSGYVYWYYNSYYYDYAKVDLGTVIVEDGKEADLVIGSGKLTEEVSITPESVVEGDKLTITYNLTDSNGNTVATKGSHYVPDNESWPAEYLYCYIDSYEDGEWVEVTGFYTNPQNTKDAYAKFNAGTAAAMTSGKRRIRFDESDYTFEFEVKPQEERASAKVYITFESMDGWNVYNVKAATALEDANGKNVLREAYTDQYGEMAILNLPIGKKYTVAVMCVDYSVGYMAKCEIDLTESAEDEEVTVTITPDESWIEHTLVQNYPDNGSDMVNAFGFAPFDGFDKIIEAGSDYGHIETIYSSGIEKEDTVFSVVMDRYDFETYDCFPLFKIAKSVDWSESNELSFGAAENMSVTVEVDGNSATLTPVVTDAFGNTITKAEYFVPYAGVEGDMPEGAPIEVTMVYPLIEVYDSEGNKVFSKNAPLEAVCAENLPEGAFLATISWNSTNLHLEGESVEFAIGNEDTEGSILTAPVAFKAKAKDNSIALSWKKPVSGAVGYELNRNGESIAELDGDALTYTDEDVRNGGYYMYTLYAIGENGARSNGVTVGVQLGGDEDNTPPVWGDGAKIEATVADGGVSIKWSRATDEGTGVTSYTLYCNGEEIAQKFTRTHTYNGLMPEVDYTFTVTATDGNGNVSEELTSEKVSLESGILGHNLVFAKNRLGYMTGTAFTAIVNTTGDIEGLQGEVKYTLADGTSKTEGVEFNGANGYFTWSKTFESTLASIDSLTVDYEEGYECIESPILRKPAKVKVNVELPDLAEIYPEGTLTLYSKALDYAYTYPVTNMEGTIEDTVIAAEDYIVTLTGGNGQVLVNQKHSITEDTEITLDENSIRLLKVVLEAPQDGFTVNLESDNGAKAGVSNEEGTIIWQNGSEWIRVGETVTLKNEKFFYSEKLTLENGINVKTITEKETDTYEDVTAHIRVKDTAGNYLNNVSVQFATSVDNKYAVTDEDGKIEAELVANKWYDYVYINIPEQKQGKRVILNKRATVAVNSTTEVIVEIGYEDIEIIPVLDIEADMDNVTFTFEGEKINLYEGKLYQRRTSGYFTKYEDIELWAEYTADGIGYKGIASFARSETQPQEVDIKMKPLVDVKLSLTDNGDVLKGAKRHFKIYGSKKRVVDSFSTYDTVSTVKLMEGESYTVYANWGTSSVSESFIVREGMEVALSLKYDGFMYEVLGGERFLKENGFTANRSISLNQNGDIYVNASFTSWNILNPDVSEAYNYIVLPEGAENVKFAGQYEYDSASCTIKKTTNIANWEGHNIDTLSFTIPYEKLTEDADVTSYIKFVYDGEAYTRDNNGFNLMDYAMTLNVPERASISEAQEGVKVSVSLPLAKKGTLEIYDGANLVASSATDEGKVKYDFSIKPSQSLGSHTIKAIYTADEVSLTRQGTLLVVDDGRPVAKKAEVSMDRYYLGDILNPTKNLTYQVSGKNIASCTATFTNPDKVERAWLVGETNSEFDRVELLRIPGTDQFTGQGRLGDVTNYVTALRIEFEEAPLSIEETGEIVQGTLEWDYELIVPVDDNDTAEKEEYEGFDFGTYPGDSENVQAKAIEDWNTYVSMVNNGIFDKDPEEAERGVKEFFGEDNTWDIPSVTDGEDSFKKSFEYNPDEIEEKLNSPEAFTVKINGEKRKVLIEVEVVGDELYVTYYGLGDLLMPSVPLIDTDTVSGAGLGSQLKGWAKNALKAYDKWKSYGEPIKDLLDKDEDDGTGGAAGGNPCGGGSESAREQRRKEVDKAFDEGWELSKKTAGLLGWLQLGGFSGGIASDILTDDNGPAHALFEFQKNRIHQIDDILDQADPDAGNPDKGDPCDPDEPNGSNDPHDDENQNDTEDSGTPIYPLVDPSGYLYRGGEGYAAEGVNASIYYLEKDGVTWTLWNSEDYGEGPNPYLSEANGYYGWDVLMGRWKVVFEGEGYQRAESIELDVPPPHLDVDIMLTSTLAPKAEAVTIKADGSIYIKFDHLMTLDSVNSDTVTVKLGDEVLTGTITPIDETVTKLGIKQKALETDAKTGVKVASIFKFTPTDAPLCGMTVSLAIDKSVLGYNGISMKNSEAYSLTVPAIDASMILYSLENVLEDNLYLTIGESFDLSSAYKAIYTDGFGTFMEKVDAPIVWSTNAEGVATVSESGIITAEGDGIATIFGECEGEMIAIGVYVERAPLKADKNKNTVKFCREDNLVVEKACYMWSDASNFSLEGGIDGDEKYMPTSWRIKEGGAITAEGTVPETESAILEIYTPQRVGVLVAEIDYELYKYSSGRWTQTGQVDTAVREIEVTEVAGIEINNPPRATIEGGVLDLSELVVDILLTDGNTSTVGYEKLASYGITTNMAHGDTVTDNKLVLTHARTGIECEVELTVIDVLDMTIEGTTVYVTINRLPEAEKVILIVAQYEGDKMICARMNKEIIRSSEYPLENFAPSGSCSYKALLLDENYNPLCKAKLIE